MLTWALIIFGFIAVIFGIYVWLAIITLPRDLIDLSGPAASPGKQQEN